MSKTQALINIGLLAALALALIGFVVSALSLS
jgi:hypothetical protein